MDVRCHASFNVGYEIAPYGGLIPDFGTILAKISETTKDGGYYFDFHLDEFYVIWLASRAGWDVDFPLDCHRSARVRLDSIENLALQDPSPGSAPSGAVAMADHFRTRFLSEFGEDAIPVIRKWFASPEHVRVMNCMSSKLTMDDRDCDSGSILMSDSGFCTYAPAGGNPKTALDAIKQDLNVTYPGLQDGIVGARGVQEQYKKDGTSQDIG